MDKYTRIPRILKDLSDFIVHQEKLIIPIEPDPMMKGYKRTGKPMPGSRCWIHILKKKYPEYGTLLSWGKPPFSSISLRRWILWTFLSTIFPDIRKRESWLKTDSGLTVKGSDCFWGEALEGEPSEELEITVFSDGTKMQSTGQVISISNEGEIVSNYLKNGTIPERS